MDQTLEAALDASRRAVDFDKNEQHTQAVYYYGVAIKLLTKLSTVPALAEKCTEYQNRIIELQNISMYTYKIKIFISAEFFIKLIINLISIFY